LDSWDSAPFLNVFLASSFLYSQALSTPTPPPVTPIVALPNKLVEMKKARTFQSDFDRLAKLDEDGWDHNKQYYNFLLAQIPPKCKTVLEIGCGTGSFSRRVSEYAEHVLALDLSPEMIKIAKRRSAKYANIDFHIADVMAWEFIEKQYDCIVSIATLHHMELDIILRKMEYGLKDDGIIMVLDLYKAEGFGDMIKSVLAVLAQAILKLKNTGRLRDTREQREAWAEHGAHDTFLPVSEVHRICSEILPGARVKQHLLWRYSIVWQK
jgi:ubiquinone/menaquinone biosynthesis C-methylase UbiE